MEAERLEAAHSFPDSLLQYCKGGDLKGLLELLGKMRGVRESTGKRY